LLVGVEQDRFEIWDIERQKLSFTIRHLVSASFFPYSDYLLILESYSLTSSEGKPTTFSIWDARTGKKRNSIMLDEMSGSEITISPDNQTLIVASQYVGLRLWDIQSGKLLHQFC
jgi:WD40 repeat protein